MKSYVEQASGVRFKWKDLRPTFAQTAKDRGTPIEVVSKALRHTSTVNSEILRALDDAMPGYPGTKTH